MSAAPAKVSAARYQINLWVFWLLMQKPAQWLIAGDLFASNLLPRLFMNKSATLHRHLCLIRLLDQPYSYPGKETLIDRLTDQGFVAVSLRTLERDLQHLRKEYGIEAIYERKRKGYFLHFPSDEDVSDFHEFVRLLERRERLEFLSQSIGESRSASRYLQLESNTHFAGLELLSSLWNALISSRVVQFTYQPYTGNKPRVRIAEPGLIFEYRNRWYLAGWCTEAKRLRTFGLDRMTNLTVTNQIFTASRVEECRSYRNHVIGVTTPANQAVERIVLRFTAQEGNYVRSLPMHASQQILEANDQSLTIALTVTPNHELEREILGYGQEVEVVEPLSLRQQIAGRLHRMQEIYAHGQTSGDVE